MGKRERDGARERSQLTLAAHRRATGRICPNPTTLRSIRRRSPCPCTPLHCRFRLTICELKLRRPASNMLAQVKHYRSRCCALHCLSPPPRGYQSGARCGAHLTPCVHRRPSAIQCGSRVAGSRAFCKMSPERRNSALPGAPNGKTGRARRPLCTVRGLPTGNVTIPSENEGSRMPNPTFAGTRFLHHPFFGESPGRPPKQL